MNIHFFTKIFFLVISRLMIVLIHPDSTTNRNSAILVMQLSDGTAMQEFTGGLAVLAFFPDRITFSATTWEVPWPVRVHNRPPRYPGVSPNAGLPLLGTRTRSPTPLKRAFWGVQFINIPVFLGKFIFGEARLLIVLLHLSPTTNRNSAIGSASPKWHSHAEPQRHEFWCGGSMFWYGWGVGLGLGPVSGQRGLGRPRLAQRSRSRRAAAIGCCSCPPKSDRFVS